MITIAPTKRPPDDFGSGEFGASRDNGKRTHNGIDFECKPGDKIVSPCSGHVTKIGYAYADGVGGLNSKEPKYRYIEITTKNEITHRVFYVEPKVMAGQTVTTGKTIIGTAQNIAARYSTAKKTMNNHVHYGVKVNGEHVNPEHLINTETKP